MFNRIREIEASYKPERILLFSNVIDEESFRNVISSDMYRIYIDEERDGYYIFEYDSESDIVVIADTIMDKCNLKDINLFFNRLVEFCKECGCVNSINTYSYNTSKIFYYWVKRGYINILKEEEISFKGLHLVRFVFEITKKDVSDEG